MSIKSRLTFMLMLSAALVIGFASAISVRAEPSLQNPTRTPTDEPTKLPYVFSTPIFIPTYTSATDLPPIRTTSTLRTPGTGNGEQTYTVEPGDNPSLIAKKVYGDAGKFRLIVEANNLTDTTRLRVGTVLIIPPLTDAASVLPTATPTAASAQTTLVIANADTSLTPTRLPTASSVATPTPQAYPSPGGVTDIGQMLLRALSVIFLAAALAIGGLAILFYRNAQRRERVSIIKRRLKGE